MENREKIEDGTSQLPRIRTSRVPSYLIRQLLRSSKILHTISRLIKAMLGIAMAGENYNFVAAILQPNGSVNDQSFRPSNAQIRVEEDHDLLLLRCRHAVVFIAQEKGFMLTTCRYRRQSSAGSEPRASKICGPCSTGVDLGSLGSLAIICRMSGSHKI